ncbi:N-acetyllactosaminide beta-1,3-N-acetylglucosaminyltransferase 2 [Osmerus eperlanus]|uniref:N-acetyllactosaminide beta-1,3-N-acetylglucosaminyltransferase 2 n=1 Tax=Osmerus eperlanus TaxID=29151 RepID=UPI002E16245C
MARCRCNGRILCLCLLPCVMMGHLVIYIMVSIFITVSYSPPHVPVRFVAPGASSNSGALAPHPLGPFWNLRLQETALWNRLQHTWDRRYNPILQGNVTNGSSSTRQGSEGAPWQGRECSSTCVSDSEQCWGAHLHDYNTLPEQMKAFVLSMHCREYPLLRNQPRLCASNESGEWESPLLLMAVKSQVGNFENRQAIRETWGRSGLVKGEQGRVGGLVRTVFLLGRQDSTTGPHPDLGGLLELESQQYRDILQWDFRDSFFNLTLKDLLFWHWLQHHCPGVQFIFKGDDDVFVRTNALLDYLHKQRAEHDVAQASRNKTETLDLFVGDVISNAKPNREPYTKYYIPESFYEGVYPPYAGGGGVVYSGSLAASLRQVSERVRMFPIDDVYLGMCLHRLGLSPGHHPGFLTFDLPESERDKPCAYSSVLLVHKRSPKDMLTLWSKLQTPPTPC